MHHNIVSFGLEASKDRFVGRSVHRSVCWSVRTLKNVNVPKWTKLCRIQFILENNSCPRTSRNHGIREKISQAHFTDFDLASHIWVKFTRFLLVKAVQAYWLYDIRLVITLSNGDMIALSTLRHVWTGSLPFYYLVYEYASQQQKHKTVLSTLLP